MRYIYIFLLTICLISCDKGKNLSTSGEGIWVPANNRSEVYGFISITGDSLTYVPNDDTPPYSAKIGIDPTNEGLNRSEFEVHPAFLFKIDKDTLYLRNENEKADVYVKFIKFEPGTTISDIHGKETAYLNDKVLAKENESEANYLYHDSTGKGYFPYSISIYKKENHLGIFNLKITSFYKVHHLSFVHFRNTDAENNYHHSHYLVTNINPDTLSLIPVQNGGSSTVYWTLHPVSKGSISFDPSFSAKNKISFRNLPENDPFNKLGIRVGSFSRKEMKSAMEGSWFLTPDKKNLVLYEVAYMDNQPSMYKIMESIPMDSSDVHIK
jgi:hypothetical protein